ncbi:hypothetical protein LPW11_02465 [Geomonas sp. RF6]|uniref:cytochrome c3 family protein n=1 Tax=Geomonas sp. RF6 TaxID=2897342 RepID=UPI001E65AE91|nr:cytochrome c3 family protein [Geomonas sp. RF6]UFS71061.1 hypothetical protein LPW11_02465 [Geomonas sp. RF6]
MRHRRAIFIVPIILAALGLAAGELRASTQGVHIVNTPHNLSKSGTGTPNVTAASDEDRVCVFCHTPHNSSLEGPLWSRKSNISMYTLYKSPTIKSLPEQPQGVSRLCLSCHDGTVALGLLLHNFEASSLGAIPAGRNTNFGTDLSKSHPISIIYPTDQEFSDKSTLEYKGIKLGFDAYVECTSCHDPHNNQYGNFLVEDTSTRHDALCVQCHTKSGWATNEDATHRTGGQRFSEVSGVVSSDGCVNCHKPHFAQRGVHLLKQADSSSGEESNCISTCHKGASYPGGDVASSFALDYRHPIQLYPGVHEANETLPVPEGKKHVQCVDCHNPHQAGFQGSPLGSTSPAVSPPSKAPEVNGPLRGVRGVTTFGEAIPGEGYASSEFQICFKCHSGGSASYFKSNRSSTQRPVRVFSSYDESVRFGASSVSFHPVTKLTTGTGRSLKSDYQNGKMQMVYCSDCHAPHGSVEPYILRENNSDTFPVGAATFPLCFRCHDDTYLYGTAGSRTLHVSHVRNHLTPCASCHDPHGIPTLTGVTQNNAAHLMNFDTRYAGAGASYDAAGRSCTVAGTCHAAGDKRYY